MLPLQKLQKGTKIAQNKRDTYMHPSMPNPTFNFWLRCKGPKQKYMINLDVNCGSCALLQLR